MDVIEAMHTWRTTREYRPEPVNREDVEDLLWHAVQVSTPPGNKEPWAFCVIEGIDRIEAYGQRALAFARDHRPQGEPGWDWVDRPGFSVFWRAPVVVVICAKSGNAQAPFDCCRAGQNLALAAHCRGFGTCWVGAAMLWLRDPQTTTELGVPSGFEPSVAMLLGHPKSRKEPQPRTTPAIVWCSDVQKSPGGLPQG